MPITPAYHALIASGSALHVVGGDIGSGPLSKAFVAEVGRDGFAGEWSESPYELPQPLSEHVALVVGRRIYVVGGANGRTALRSTYSAELPAKGAVGPWQTEPVLLPQSLRGHAGAVVGRTIFVIGGKDEGGKARSEVFNSAVDDRDQLRNWERSASLPQPLANAGFAGLGRQVYLVGGENDKGPVSTVYAGFAGPTGELTWRVQRPLPRPLSRGAVFIYGRTIYHIGGFDGTTATSEAYAAAIKDDGSLDDWIGWLPLPRGSMGLAATMLNNVVYVSGGFDGARYLTSLQFLPVAPPSPAATVAPTAPQRSSLDVLSTVMTASAVVAAISLLLVAAALVREKWWS